MVFLYVCAGLLGAWFAVYLSNCSYEGLNSLAKYGRGRNNERSVNIRTLLRLISLISQSVLGCGSKETEREKERVMCGNIFQVGGGKVFFFSIFFWSEIFSASEATSAAPGIIRDENIST